MFVRSCQNFVFIKLLFTIFISAKFAGMLLLLLSNSKFNDTTRRALQMGHLKGTTKIEPLNPNLKIHF